MRVPTERATIAIASGPRAAKAQQEANGASGAADGCTELATANGAPGGVRPATAATLSGRGGSSSRKQAHSRKHRALGAQKWE
jgi:hypothetical protein